MFRFSRILFPTDFTYSSFYAMKYAMAFAKRYHARLDLVHCVSTTQLLPWAIPSYWLLSEGLCAQETCLCERAAARLRHLVRMLSREGIAAEYYVTRGEPAGQIAALARDLACDLIVVGTHGRVGMEHALLGSVAEEVARHSPTPVLTIKHPEHEFVQFREGRLLLKRVLFPTDFSSFSLSAIPYAASLCREFDATLLLTHIVEPAMYGGEFLPDVVIPAQEYPENEGRRQLEQLAAEFPHVKVEVRQEFGLSSSEIVRLAGEWEADLVVIPTHGRSGVARLFLGGVAHKVLRRAHCPVLTIRPDMATVKQTVESAVGDEAGRESALLGVSV